MKAMILAAGRGSRMRPLTDEIPKPLLPIANKPFIVHQLLKLADAGLKDIVINVSYRAKQIIDALGNGHRYGVNLEYSFEPTALETGGGICQALPFLGNDPFLVISADIWTDYPLEKLYSQQLDFWQGAAKMKQPECINIHEDRELSGNAAKNSSAKSISQHKLGTVLAHLILVDNPDFHPEGDFHLLPNKLLDLNGSPKLTFANLGIYHPELFKDCKPQAFPLSEIFHKRINEKKITGEHYQGSWFNVGTLNELTRLDSYLKQENK